MGAATAKRRHIPRRTPHRRPTPDSDAGAPGPDSGTGVPSSGSGAGIPDPGQPAQAGAMPPCDHRRVHPEASAMPAANTVQPPARPSPQPDPAPSLIQSPARSSFQRHLQRAILRLSILYHSRVIKYQLISKEEEGVRRAECKLPSRVRQNMGVFRVSRRSSHPIRPSLPGKTYRSILKREFFPHVDD